MIRALPGDDGFRFVSLARSGEDPKLRAAYSRMVDIGDNLSCVLEESQVEEEDAINALCALLGDVSAARGVDPLAMFSTIMEVSSVRCKIGGDVTEEQKRRQEIAESHVSLACDLIEKLGAAPFVQFVQTVAKLDRFDAAVLLHAATHLADKVHPETRCPTCAADELRKRAEVAS